jgi:hypothetical protein
MGLSYSSDHFELQMEEFDEFFKQYQYIIITHDVFNEEKSFILLRNCVQNAFIVSCRISKEMSNMILNQTKINPKNILKLIEMNNNMISLYLNFENLKDQISFYCKPFEDNDHK